VIPEAVRALAEEPDRFTLPSPIVERFADERVCIIAAPTWANVVGVRVGKDEVEALLAEVRGRISPGKTVHWWVGPSCRPVDLHERLLALGIEAPRGHPDVLHALACVQPPPPGPDDVEVRTVDDFDDFVLWTRTMWEAFDLPAARRERERPHLEAMWASERDSGVPRSFLALLDGRPAGTARSIYAPQGSFMVAGATVPWARRRGVYRALVRARWDDAAARGTPALVTTAMPETSQPVLLRMGFEAVCEMRLLEETSEASE
jgi:hypothetical protein